MTFAVVWSLAMPRRLRPPQELDDFEQELVDQYALAASGAGTGDGSIAAERSVIFLHPVPRPPGPTATAEDADRFLTHQRKSLRLAGSTVQQRAWTLARFYEFLITRYQTDIHAVTGHVVEQPIDEYNRPVKADYGVMTRIPPAEQDVEEFFALWRAWLPSARKYLPAARDYLAASLWRRVGLRISETTMLDIRDWRPDLGDQGKLNVRYGKGSMGRGPKPRLVPAINSVDSLITWWLTDVDTSSVRTMPIPTRRCCPASAATESVVGVCGPVTMRCGRGWR